MENMESLLMWLADLNQQTHFGARFGTFFFNIYLFLAALDLRSFCVGFL